MGQQENNIEKYLDSEIKLLGGKTYKWVSPGCSGVPDRIVVVSGVVDFIEVKTINKEAKPWQQKRINELLSLGVHAQVVSGKTGVDEYIRHLYKRLKG